MPPRPPPASTEAFPSLPLTPRTSPRPLHLPSLPLDPVLSSAFLPARARAELVVADAVRRSHRAPRCHPKYPGDPPRPPLPPRREAHRGSPCIAAIAVVFYLGPAGHLRQIRRLRTIPGLVSASNGSAVSLRCLSCARPLRSRPLAPTPTAAESFSPPAMAWPWPQPPQLVPEPTIVISTIA